MENINLFPQSYLAKNNIGNGLQPRSHGKTMFESPAQTQEIPVQPSISQNSWFFDITPIALAGVTFAFCWAVIKGFQK